MKCPTCDYNQRRGKQGMTCKKCGYKFVFDPKRHGLTDGKFLSNVHRASSNDTYYFTENQLYATACRRLRSTIAPLLTFIGISVFFFFFLSFAKMPPMLQYSLGALAFLILLATCFSIHPKLKRKTWNKHLKRWHKKQPPLKKLIRSPELNSPPAECPEPDIYDYGVEQILICERDEIVDWLVLNRYHVTNKTAVIGENGYPEYLIPKINALLASDAPPRIYLLHDAPDKSPPMITRVRESRIFDLYEADIVDLGLSESILPRIKSIKKVRRSLKSDSLPVDTIPFGTLTSMTACAFASHCAFDAFGPDIVGSSGLEFESCCSDDGDGE